MQNRRKDLDELARRHLGLPYQADNIDYPCSAHDSPLSQAVRTENLERLQEQMNQYDIKVTIRGRFEIGCEVNERCTLSMLIKNAHRHHRHEFNKHIPCNFTPLHVACIGNQKDMVAFLLENSADLNAKDCEGRTPSYYALREENVDILRLLIDAGADLVTKDIYGGNILYHACRAQFDPEIFSLLESYGLSFINDQTTEGRTALMDACMRGNCSLAGELIKLGADVTLADNDGLLPIHMAALSGYKIFKLLLQHTPADAIEKYSTFQTGSEKWRSLPCCIIERCNFESLKLLYSSGLSEAVLSCPGEADNLLLSPVAFLLVSLYYADEVFTVKCLKFLLSYEFLIDPAYETVGEIQQDGNKFGKMWLKRLNTLEAVIHRHNCNYYENECCCKLYLSTILSHSSNNYNKMLPYGYARQLDFFSDCARYGFLQGLGLLKYAEYVNPDDILKEFLKRLMSDSLSRLVGYEECVIRFLLKKCVTNFMTTFLEMKTLALQNLRFGGLSPDLRCKYEMFLKIYKMAESNNRVATLENMCRHTLRKSIQRKAEESKETFQTCIESIPMPPVLYKRIRYDIR